MQCHEERYLSQRSRSNRFHIKALKQFVNLLMEVSLDDVLDVPWRRDQSGIQAGFHILDVLGRKQVSHIGNSLWHRSAL